MRRVFLAAMMVVWVIPACSGAPRPERAPRATPAPWSAPSLLSDRLADYVVEVLPDGDRLRLRVWRKPAVDSVPTPLCEVDAARVEGRVLRGSCLLAFVEDSIPIRLTQNGEGAALLELIGGESAGVRVQLQATEALRLGLLMTRRGPTVSRRCGQGPTKSGRTSYFCRHIDAVFEAATAHTAKLRAAMEGADLWQAARAWEAVLGARSFPCGEDPRGGPACIRDELELELARFVPEMATFRAALAREDRTVRWVDNGARRAGAWMERHLDGVFTPRRTTIDIAVSEGSEWLLMDALDAQKKCVARLSEGSEGIATCTGHEGRSVRWRHEGGRLQIRLLGGGWSREGASEIGSTLYLESIDGLVRSAMSTQAYLDHQRGTEDATRLSKALGADPTAALAALAERVRQRCAARGLDAATLPISVAQEWLLEILRRLTPSCRLPWAELDDGPGHDVGALPCTEEAITSAIDGVVSPRAELRSLPLP